MEAEIKHKRLRIITGTCAEVEHQLNELLDKYIAQSFTFSVVGNEVHVTVLLMHESVVRMMQIAQPQGALRRN
jgi:hypothetical protein